MTAKNAAFWVDFSISYVKTNRSYVFKHSKLVNLTKNKKEKLIVVCNLKDFQTTTKKERKLATNQPTSNVKASWYRALPKGDNGI